MSSPLLQPDAGSHLQQNRPASIKSNKQPLSKSIKHAFSRRKRSGSFRSGNGGSEADISSQRSGSVEPEGESNTLFFEADYRCNVF